MATLTDNVRDRLISIYNGLFQAAPGLDDLNAMAADYEAGMSQKQIAAKLALEANFTTVYPTALLNTEFTDSLVTFLLGSGNDLIASGDKVWATNWVLTKLNAGVPRSEVVVQAVNALAAATNPAYAESKLQLENRLEVSKYYALDKSQSSDDLLVLQDIIAGVTNEEDSVVDAKAEVDEIAANNSGTTFPLVAAAESLTGGAGNDIFNGSNTTVVLDVLNGASGNDTLNFSDTAGGTDIGAVGVTLISVETVNVRSVGAANADASALVGVENLNLLQGTSATAVAAATTNVGVSGIAGAISVDGAKDVTVTDAVANNSITVGNTTAAAGAVTVTDSNQGTGNIAVDGASISVTATTTNNAAAGVTVGDIDVGLNTRPTGDVVIVSNLNSNGLDTLTGSDIDVYGGSTISITVNAISTAADNNADADITTGDIEIGSDGNTTSVTIDQNATATINTKAAVAVVKETSVVTFAAMTTGQTVIVNGLTFTAAKNLTAAEVASAFANLVAADTQSSGGVTTNGEYTGTFNTAVWTSGAASGAVVTFTATDEDEADLVFTGTATAATQVKTTGTAAVAIDKSTNAVNYGEVYIEDSATAAMTTISIKGYGANSSIDNTTVLATLSLSKAASGADMYVENTAATLALTVEGVGETGTDAILELDNGPETLNVTSTGANWINLTSAATKNLNVSGTGVLDIDTTDLAALAAVVVSGTAGLKLNATVVDTLTSISTTGTTGAVTATIDGSKATYAGGAGNDTVTLSATTVDKSINLGDGDNSLTLATGTSALTSEVIAGAGTKDTLVMAGADAATVSAAAVFETKVTGFERLSLTAIGNNTVNIANLDDINYVTTAGAAAATVLKLDGFVANGTLAVSTAAFAGSSIDLNLADASGTADVLNIVSNLAATGNIRTIDATGVETINLTATGSTTTAVVTTVSLVDANLTTLNISGNGGVTLTTDSTVLTLVDASTLKGVLTADTNGTVAQTIKGGEGADVLRADFAQDVLIGGAGADTLTVANGANLVSLQGGAGKDTYVIGFTTNVNGYATISGSASDLSGDVISFATAIGDFSNAKLVLGDTAVFQDYANEAAKATDGSTGHDVFWFQLGGATYVIQDNSDSASYDNAADVVVKIAGLVEFTFNATSNILEIA